MLSRMNLTVNSEMITVRTIDAHDFYNYIYIHMQTSLFTVI